MNEHDARLMQGPSIETLRCPFCGRMTQNRHHIVPRSRGGSKGPTVTVCGFGNASGCHGKLHGHTLHLDWRDGAWWYLDSGEPTKYHEALGKDGWKRLII